jgi:pimeloyl-ACP methyl ester carboxylesterase
VTRPAAPVTVTLTGATGNRLVADIYGDRGDPIMLLHGGGQTRHAWRKTAERIARTGRKAYAIDQRGHGDSEWIADGDYAFGAFAGDARAVADAIAAQAGRRPITIGASLGGIASLLAEGAAEDEGANVFAALVLVDVTPRVDLSGVAKVHGFMSAYARRGFASVEEAAEAVAQYLPHRPRPQSLDGLKKNLRLSPDDRWRWHWDPRFIETRVGAGIFRDEVEAVLLAAARKIRIPALLVRGGSSQLVQEAHAREFLELVPHAEMADVSGARHMVAGDQNDAFGAAILDFLDRLET